MPDRIYKKLAKHLDDLPAGFPATDSGVEISILKRLFTPEEADLALHLNLIPERSAVIARRAGIGEKEADSRLEDLVRKGLIFSMDFPGRPTLYMASQYVIGIWEYQVDNLNEGLIRDMNRYLPTFMNPDTWKKAPQLRTIPVGRSVDASMHVLPHEKADELIRNKKKIRLLPCICRREHTMTGEGCGKPEETCLVFGTAAYFYEKRGIGRDIEMEECLDILNQADREGLVLQPNNAQNVTNICCCCGCCCQILIHVGRHSKPAEIVSSPFIAEHYPDSCTGCGVCEDRCQMRAISIQDDRIVLAPDRCIGCGLCVSTCPTHSLKLVRKFRERQTPVPADTMESHIRLARTRGKMGRAKMLKMSLESKWDRWLARS